MIKEFNDFANGRCLRTRTPLCDYRASIDMATYYSNDENSNQENLENVNNLNYILVNGEAIATDMYSSFNGGS